MSSKVSFLDDEAIHTSKHDLRKNDDDLIDVKQITKSNNDTNNNSNSISQLNGENRSTAREQLDSNDGNNNNSLLIDEFKTATVSRTGQQPLASS